MCLGVNPFNCVTPPIYVEKYIRGLKRAPIHLQQHKQIEYIARIICCSM